MPTELYGETAPEALGPALSTIADNPPHNSKGFGIVFNSTYGNSRFRDVRVALDITARYLDARTLAIQDTTGVDPSLLPGGADPSGLGLDVAQLLDA